MSKKKISVKTIVIKEKDKKKMGASKGNHESTSTQTRQD